MANILEILVRAKDDASKTLEQVNRSVESMSRQYKIAGGIMLGASAAITGAMLLAVKAAAEEQQGIVRLSTAMRNVGLDYDKVKDSLEAWVDAQQQKTAIADSDQRESLASLITMTGNLEQSQKLLTLAMDIAAGTGRDLSSVTQMVGQALAGNWGIVNRMIPGISELKTEEEKWLFLRQKFAGQAEAFAGTLAGQFQLLQNNIGDLKEQMGSLLMTSLAPLIERANAFAQALKNMDPDMLRMITNSALLSAGLLAVGGGFLMFLGLLPNLLAGYRTLITLINTATVTTWGFYASFAAVVVIALALASAISYLSGNTARMSERWDDLSIATKLVIDPFRAIAELTMRIADETRKATDQIDKNWVPSLSRATAEIEGQKIALAEATWMLEGITYKTQLFSEAEIEAATNAGKLVTRIDEVTRAANKQADDMKRAQEMLNQSFQQLMDRIHYADSEAAKFNITMYDIYDAMDEVGYGADEIKAKFALWGDEIGSVEIALKAMGWTAEFVAKLIQKTSEAIKEEQGRLRREAERMREVYAPGTRIEDIMADIRRTTGPFAPSPYPEVPIVAFQHGGQVQATGLAFLHRGETVLPANALVTIPIYLDGELITSRVVEIVGSKARLQGY